MARLDRLAPVKEVAQVAAVIGREFSHDLLAAVAVAGRRRAAGRARPAGRGGAGLPPRRAARRQATPSSTRWSGTRPTRACSRAGGSSSTPGSRRSWRSASREGGGRARAAGAALRRGGPGRAGRPATGGGRRSWRSGARPTWRRSPTATRRRRSSGRLPPSAERARAELEVQLAKGVAVRAGRGYSAPEAERVFFRACELCEELGDRVRLAHALRGLVGLLLRRRRGGRTRPGSRSGSTRPRRASTTA